MMRKKNVLVLILILTISLIIPEMRFGLMTTTAEAATVPAFASKNMIVFVGKDAKLILSNSKNIKKTTWSVTGEDKGCIKLSAKKKGSVKAIGKTTGKAAIKAKVIYMAGSKKKTKTLKCTVKVRYDIPSTEYERAVWYGIADAGTNEEVAATEPISYKDFCAMAGRMIELYKSSALKEWNKLTKKAPDIVMKREAAFLGMHYLAEAVDLNIINDHMHPYDDYDFCINASWEDPVFSIDTPVKSNVDPLFEDRHMYSRIDNASFYFTIRRKSCITGFALLETTNGDWRIKDNLTYKEAAEAIVRLYESDEEIAFATSEKILEMVLETTEAKEILKKADERREAILNTNNKIVKSDKYIQGKTYTGTAYYVSNNGDDNNDGLSEATPIKTINRLKWIELHEGDAVFFERGSVWDECEYLIFDDVERLTFSAYGEGPKPVISGALGNASGADKWTLYYEGKDGRKIWKYYEKSPEVGVIVFNEGESYAKRDAPYWDGKKYIDIKNYRLGEDYDVKKHLENMCFFPALEYKPEPFDPTNMFLEGIIDKTCTEVFVTGELYLRCDEGNPGELFNDIRRSTPYSFMRGMYDYGTCDNLCFAYSIQTIAGGATPERGAGTHLLFQNCEAKWIGGGVYHYGEDFPDVALMGGGFNCAGGFEQIINCYTHHCYQEGPTCESFEYQDGMLEDIRYEGNLTEYCVMGNMFTNWDQTWKDTHLFKNVTYKDNIVLFSGFENLYTKKPFMTEKGRSHEYIYGSLTTDSRAFGLVTATNGLNAYVGSFDVSDNIFAFSYGKLIEISTFTEEYSKVFNHNTYAQLPGFAWLSAYSEAEGTWHSRPRMIDPKAAIIDKMGDKRAKIIRFD